MTFETIISILVVVASFAVKLIGSPSQIKHLVAVKDSRAVSLLQWLLVFVTYVLWLIYGLVKNDLIIIVGQGVGILTSGVVIFFIIKYRKNNAQAVLHVQ